MQTSTYDLIKTYELKCHKCGEEWFCRYACEEETYWQPSFEEPIDSIECPECGHLDEEYFKDGNECVECDKGP